MYADNVRHSSFLDIMMAPHEFVGHHTKYFKFVSLAVFESLGIPT